MRAPARAEVAGFFAIGGDAPARDLEREAVAARSGAEGVPPVAREAGEEGR